MIGTLKGDLAAGRWFEDGLTDLPTTVLGAKAADKLGAGLGHRVWIGQRWWAVIGILRPLGLASDLDSTAFLAPDRARELYPEIPISAIYLASTTGKAEAVRGVTPSTANPANPGGVAVSQLSAYAGAQEIISEVFTRLSLGLGAVALLDRKCIRSAAMANPSRAGTLGHHRRPRRALPFAEGRPPTPNPGIADGVMVWR